MKYGTATILIVGLLSACSSVNTMPTKESKTINQNIQPTLGRPNLTAPEVLTKALDFLRYAQSPEDFQIETAEKVMKIKFAPYSKEEKSAWDFYAGNNFGNTGWSWWINFNSKEKSGKVHLFFGRGEGNPPATSICQIDLDQFHPLLEQAGFTYTGKGHWGRPFNGYEKKYRSGYEADLQVFYRGESAEKVLHDCINEITFNIFKPGS